MHLFSEYIQPLTIWLHTHSNWALFITFFISFCESLAVIGTIIPGSVAMTAIGILAGSGVMRIDLTLIAAILGAIAGDSASFLLGYLFRDRICNIWPFTRYPHWIAYGKAFWIIVSDSCFDLDGVYSNKMAHGSRTSFYSFSS